MYKQFCFEQNTNISVSNTVKTNVFRTKYTPFCFEHSTHIYRHPFPLAHLPDIQLHLQGQLNGRDNKIHVQQQHIEGTLPRMYEKIEELKNVLVERDHQMLGMQHELGSLRNILKERESKIPELQDTLDKQRLLATKQQEEMLFKNNRLETLQVCVGCQNI